MTSWLRPRAPAAALGLLLGACFRGDFLAGTPCSDDFECGPGHRCIDRRCDGVVTDNLAPIAGDDRYEALMDIALVVGADDPDALLANDEDLDGDAIALRPGEVASRRGGAVTFDGGAFSYEPPPDFWGCDEFTYHLDDSREATASAQVRLAVRPTEARLGRAVAVGSGHRLADDTLRGIGSAVAGLGDIDGDGFADVGITANLAPDNVGSSPLRPRVYVVLGGEDLTTRTLAGVAAGEGGFIVEFEAIDLQPSEGAGGPRSVRGLGDVDGDGLDDFAVGGASVGVHVIFGRHGTAPVEIAALRAGLGGGFTIEGESPGDHVGAAFDAAGDVDGDGRRDLWVGAPDFPGEQGIRGRVYLVLGRSGGAPVQLAQVAAGAGGYTISPAYLEDEGLGGLLAGGEDVDGDGVPDVVIGSATGKIRVHLVAGKTDTAPLEIAYDSYRGFLIYSVNEVFDGDEFFVLDGLALSPDIDGDGLAEVLMHATHSQPAVIFGKADDEIVTIESLAGPTGFRIGGLDSRRVAAAGDLDGDGAADLLIAANTDDPDLPPWDDPGRVIVFPGAAATVESPVLAAFLEESAGTRVGDGLARAGDVDGDGVDDLIFGSPGGGAVHIVATGACK